MTTIQRRNLGLTLNNEEKSAGGYTLFAPQTGNGKVILINSEVINTNGIYLFVLAEMQSFSIMVILDTTEVMRNLWTFILHGTFGMVVILWKSHQAEILSGNMKILITIMTLSGCIIGHHFTQLHHLFLM